MSGLPAKEQNQPITFLVSLWLVHANNADDVAAFEAFEREAQQLMQRHGGRIERSFRPVASGSASPPAAMPFEIQVVTFQSREGFETYRADPEVSARADRRNSIIARTELQELRESHYLLLRDDDAHAS